VSPGGRGGANAAAGPGAGGSRGGRGGEARADAPPGGSNVATGADTAGASRGRGRRGGGGDLVRRGAAGADARDLRMAPEGTQEGGFKPGAVYVLKNGKPDRIMVLTGITDGSFTEVKSDRLKPGDPIIIGAETPARGAALQPPPGMGGPGMRGPGGGGGRR